MDSNKYIEIDVWTNGKAIRKYTGQDKSIPKQIKDSNSSVKCDSHVKQNGWYKATV